jgi:hypothetical protein
MTISTNDSPSRLTSLDVIGLGISIEDFRILQVWDAIRVNPKAAILSTDPRDYPELAEERRLATESRAAFALGAAAKYFVQHWPIPSVSVWPHRDTSGITAGTHDLMANYFANRIDCLREAAGMPSHQIATLGAFCQNEPEEVLERAFQFFDANPEVPALLLFAADGDMTRKLVGDTSREANWEDGPRRFDSMAETMVALVLARRDRVDTYLRPFAGSRATHLYAAGPAKHGYKPSKYLPEPWTAEQIDQFDALQTIAVLHRPIRVSYRKEQDGQLAAEKQQMRLITPQRRLPIFQEAFDTALQSLPEGKPARIFYDTGGGENGGNITPLYTAALASLPDLDLNNPEDGIDISQRIGNTGACSPFVMWALAAMTGFKNGEASIAVHLRQQEEATITAITPSKKKPQVQPVKAAAPAKVAPPKIVRPPAPRNVALGARLSSGDECTQTGIWRCAPADMDAGDTHFLLAGRTLPNVSVAKKPTLVQKAFRVPAWEKVAAEWTLVSYDEPAYS